MFVRVATDESSPAAEAGCGEDKRGPGAEHAAPEVLMSYRVEVISNESLPGAEAGRGAHHRGLGAAHAAPECPSCVSEWQLMRARLLQRRVAERIKEAREQSMQRLKSSCHTV